VALWYVPVTMVNGHAFIDEFIIKHHFRRFLTNRYKHPQPVWFFPVVTLAGLLPWTFFLLPATARLRRIKPRSGEPKDTLLTLAWIWLLAPLIFFSISQSKLPSYILPAFPALAIIVGFEIERFWRGERDRLLAAAAWLTALSVIAFAVALPVYLRQEALLGFNLDAVFYLAPILLAILTAAALVMSRRRAMITGVTATVLSLVIGATIILLPHLDDEIGLKRLSLTVAGELRPGEKMTFYQNKNYAPVFYAAGRAVTSIERGEGLNSFALEEVIKALESEASLIVITTAANQSLFTDNPLFAAEMIAQQGNHRALRVRLVQRDPAPESTS
jgi:4-amino-4-deoxy-L-arabinose transferase-like glycosyltransferase